MSKQYDEQLRDPRWQRLRLELLNEAGWACQACGDTKEELNVHHMTYSNDGRPAWDYPVTNFRCLCRTCHDLAHFDESKVKRYAQKLIFSEVEWPEMIAEMKTQAQLNREAYKKTQEEYRERMAESSFAQPAAP